MRTLVPTLALVALASSCTLNTDYFGDYRGVNLISAYDFGTAGKWNLESYAPYATVDLTPGSSYDPTYTPDDYMTWTSVATEFASTTDGTKSLATGPDGVSPAHRLEIKNLFQDGDFENGQSGSAFSAPDTGWWTVGAAATVQFGAGPFTAGGGSFSSVAKTSLYMSGDATNNLDIHVKEAFPSTALFQRKGSYRFWFDFYHATEDTTVFDLSIVNQTSSSDWKIVGLETDIDKTTHIYTKGNLFLLDGSADDAEITLGGGTGANEAVLDNFRIANADISPFVVLTLPSLSSGTLPLLSGQKTGAYLLKFWVHDDPTADQTGLSGTPDVAHALNRLHPSGVSVRVKAAVKSGSGVVEQFVPRPEGGWPIWTQITVPMGFDFVNVDSLIPAGENALDIAFSPTNTTTDASDAGSVLIAQPSFEFNP